MLYLATFPLNTSLSGSQYRINLGLVLVIVRKGAGQLLEEQLEATKGSNPGKRE